MSRSKPKMKDVTEEVMSEKLRIICTLSPSEKKVIRAFSDHDLVVCCGPAGCGKTFSAVATGFDWAIKNNCRICISRPVVESGEHLGFLPGLPADKFAPFFAPIEDCLSSIVSNVKIARGMIDILPLAYARGRTVNGVFILDEAQNCSFSQIILAVTRIGRGSKMLITTDPFQSDRGGDAIIRFMEAVDGVEGIKIIDFDAKDQQRSGVVSRILERLADSEDASYEDRGD